MSRSDREKWDGRYASQRHTDDYQASALLEDALERLTAERRRLTGLRALDLASGAGRNSILIAQRGMEVDAIDVSAEGLAIGARRWAEAEARAEANDRMEGGSIQWIQADLHRGLPLQGGYDLIVVVRFLDLTLLRTLPERLNPGGMLVVELHLDLRGDPAWESVSGPGNPVYLVAPGALAAATAGLEVLRLEEGVFETGAGRREALARFVGIRAATQGNI
jgi:SAM-dependent methyltransferase